MVGIERFAVFAGALAAGCAIPGPATAAVAARGLTYGVRAALPLCAGLVLGDLFWCAISMYGAGAVFERWPILLPVLKYIGVVWLAWLAWKFWHGPAAMQESIGSARSAFDGLAIALANPKTMLFYLALLPVLLDARGVTLSDFFAPALVIVFVCGGVMLLYAFAAAAVRRRWRSPRPLPVQRIAAVLIVATALLLAVAS